MRLNSAEFSTSLIHKISHISQVIKHSKGHFKKMSNSVVSKDKTKAQNQSTE